MSARLSLDDATLSAFVHAMTDAVIVCDAEGAIAFWNDSAHRVFGWDAEHAVGQSLDLIIPDRLRSAHWHGYKRVVAGAEPRYGTDLLRVPALHASGEQMSIALTLTLLRDPDGSVAATAAVVRDETQRWEEERELRRKVREADGR